MDDEIREKVEQLLKAKKKTQLIASFCVMAFAILFILAGIMPAEDAETTNKVPLFIMGGVFIVIFLVLFIKSKQKINEKQLEEIVIKYKEGKLKLEDIKTKKSEKAKAEYLERITKAKNQISELTNKIRDIKVLLSDEIDANVTLTMKGYNESMPKIEVTDLIKKELFKKFNDEEASINETYKQLCKDYNLLLETYYFYMNSNTNTFQLIVLDNYKVIKTVPILFEELVDFDIREKNIDLSNSGFQASVGGMGYHGDYFRGDAGGVDGTAYKVSTKNFSFSLVTIKTKNKNFPVLTFKILDEQEMLKLKAYLEMAKNYQNN